MDDANQTLCEMLGYAPEFLNRTEAYKFDQTEMIRMHSITSVDESWHRGVRKLVKFGC